MVARTRGQVLVLGAVALLVMALMLMASFSVTNAIHEKIRLQSHADAQAYSLAVIEARAFNVTAHYNRAIAAALVGQMSLHSWMAIAGNDVAMLNAGAVIMFIIFGIEMGMGCPLPNPIHCVCAAMAIVSAGRFLMAANDWGRKLQGLEQKFNDGVDGLKKMVDSLHGSQLDALDRARSELAGGVVLGSLRQGNAAMATNASMAGANIADYACAVEGTSFDGSCSGARQRNKLGGGQRSAIMNGAANAARPMFDRFGPSASLLSHSDTFSPQMDPRVPKDQLLEGNFTQFFVTQAGVNDTDGVGFSPGQEIKTVGAGNLGMGVAMVSGFRHSPPVPMPFGSTVFSSQQGGSHSMLPFGSGHSGNHDRFRGVNQHDPCNNESCFVNYRSLPDPRKDFGQPTVIAGARQSLRVIKGKGGGFGSSPAWEINGQGRVRFEFTQGQPADVQYVARGEGYAVAKAKVYFHQLGDWQAPPQFFDPFWRAKLHFFSRQELAEALQAVGDTVGSQLVRQGAPVEGEL